MENVGKNGVVFLIDDEPIQNEMLQDYLAEKLNYSFLKFETGEDALKKLHMKPAFVVIDYHLNSHKPSAMDGIAVLKEIRAKMPNSNVVMLSGQDKIDVAIESLKFGAKDYVIKGETAFSRIENIFTRIAAFESIKKNNSRYKLLINVLVMVYGLIIVYVIYRLFTEYLGIEL